MNFFRSSLVPFAAVLWLTYSAPACQPAPPSDPDPTGTSNLPDSTAINVSYGTHPRQKYDIYLPAKRDTNTPFLVVIHGGGWKAGQKEDMNFFVQLIRNRWKNVAIVNMNYRLASFADSIHHPQMMEDIQNAIGHVLQHRQQYYISNKAGVMGASAGGQLSMIYAYKYNHHQNIRCVVNIFGPTIINDWSWYSSNNPWLGGSVGDILAEYVGQPWDSAAYAAVSPYWQATASSQPTIAFHGSLDPIVPVYQSRWMNGRLNLLGVPNQLHEYVAFHAFDYNQSQDVANKLVSFCKQYMK
ncbi:MAG: alpha/beta hydrolase [Chitinophagales bacterium]|nr:alpha/beta hydrolase [Chitinophagales bacterium]